MNKLFPLGVTIAWSISAMAQRKDALLVLDIQKDFIGAHAKLPVDSNQAEKMIKVVNELIRTRDKTNLEVIYIGNEFNKYDIGNMFRHHAAIRGSEGTLPDSRLIWLNENYFPKCHGNAFSNPQLNNFLKQRGIRHVYVVGLCAEACVKFTINGALKNGYQPFVVTDGLASKNDRSLTKSIHRFEKSPYIGTISSSQILSVN